MPPPQRGQQNPVNVELKKMPYVYKPNEAVLHRPQGPQGRAATEPPMIYTIVSKCRSSPMDEFGTVSRASPRGSRGSLRKIRCRILSSDLP
jgi:hypothetical protein